MAKHYEPEEIREILVGTWHAEWATRTGGVAKATYRFHPDGTYDDGASVENAVSQNFVGYGSELIGHFNRNWGGLGTFRVDDNGDLILRDPKGKESRRRITLGDWGNELQMGELFFTKRS